MIEQKVENATQQDYSLDSCLKQVEKAGRICYDSEDKITDDSYINFTKKLKNNRHFSPFGHGTLILNINTMQHEDIQLFAKITNSLEPYFNRYKRLDDYLIISARVIIEIIVLYKGNGDMLNRLHPFIVSNKDIINKIFTKCPQYKRLTFKCTTSIAMTRELNRHAWSLDICEQSTRYVEAGNWIKPWNWDNLTELQQQLYINGNDEAFNYYQKLLLTDLPKQEARNFLPLDIVTEVYYTAFRYQWEEVIAKRTARGVHPQMIDLMDKIKNKII